ncbi:DUF4148 domain-containing protein [Burkholderia thailandensis]|uniref:DUF4148 domain-containing protein n=2 Tax=Burkholderia thailandensis TaxID=57975 RepID=A0AAW9CM26_BURTH|nr:DUF4148 domain-containing protein [Burkholderia thailandensis]ABC35247.1 conserved hypothetical protein [Burkholderia thailandensis E264]AHI67861.1 hypothetical protein BTL_4338 [Burkholderia thailandensis H0587]AHI76558.1 hypothetical protein BTQ_4864 [Burkholderia thailandensis 2002721723]AHI82390.1 hypothetical protein BTJ_3489 [Burkholderia thailandensis E444]AIC89277.1 hypothetical protein BTRA_4104 [Burkholderia thailandensis USAMRU Malaysia \
MKTALKMAALALALTVPALSFAQSSTNGPMTRAQVRNELIQYEKAGYQPSKNQYPADVQAAEARIARANGGADMSGYGGAAGGATQSGYRVSPTSGGWDTPYRHH